MSLVVLSQTIEDLPFTLREQVVGYAESVERAAPEIFRDVGRKYDARLADRLVFRSGIKKLYGIVSGAYWTLDNSAALLAQSDIHEIRIGGTAFIRGAGTHERIRQLLKRLDEVLAEQKVRHLISLAPCDMLQELLMTDGRSSRS
jgi:hypothetical protein